MRKRLVYGSAIVLLALSVLFVAWQGSFHLRSFGPSNPQETLIFWAISILNFALMVALGWVLTRTAIKLYVDRQANREGSRIRTKLVLGGLALSIVPVFCLVLFGVEVLNVNMKAWFTKPAEEQLRILNSFASQLRKDTQDKTEARAALLAMEPEARGLLTAGTASPGFLERFCKEQGLVAAAVYGPSGFRPVASWTGTVPAKESIVVARRPVQLEGKSIGFAEVAAQEPLDIAQARAEMDRQYQEQGVLYENRKTIRFNYMMLMGLITLFVLSVATWLALFLAKQISVPITALLEAAREVSRGNLSHRLDVKATDELGALVRSFNSMTEELETGSRELDRRRRFTEAILESIPSGVISIGPDGSILRVNRALDKIFPPERAQAATRLEDLFSRDDAARIKHLMKRARRAGSASTAMELRAGGRKLQIEVTVSSLEENIPSGFVVVLEDATELLRAQKAEAWHEVARRVAHEIKNPLTPISLSAERIERQMEKLALPEQTARIVRDCTGTIAQSVESVKTLVDEFSQYARFPSALPVPSDLNEVVQEALAIFHGRLDAVSMSADLAPGLPPVNLDREQFRRVIVNLVDNAAEAMQDALVKQLHIATRLGPGGETVELIVADTGCGIGPEDKEKLFLPYFSTKNRGTGLGLAIASHIVAEHGAHIRVEDNRPVGARFTVDLPTISEADPGEPGQPAASPAAVIL